MILGRPWGGVSNFWTPPLLTHRPLAREIFDRLIVFPRGALGLVAAATYGVKPAPEPPIPLAGEALTFWRSHYRRLKRSGILTRADVESFAVLCLTWGKIQSLAAIEPGADNYREMIQLINLVKQYQSLAKQFGLLPRERKAAKMDDATTTKKDEFDL